MSASDDPTLSMCARWLKYQVAKDPFFKEDTPALFRKFAEEQGYGVDELNWTFKAEEEFYREQDQVRKQKSGRTRLKSKV